MWWKVLRSGTYQQIRNEKQPTGQRENRFDSILSVRDDISIELEESLVNWELSVVGGKERRIIVT